MGNQGGHQSIKTRQSRQRTGGEDREPSLVSLGQITQDLGHLALNKIGVVQEPFRAGRETLAHLDRLIQGPAHDAQGTLAPAEPRQKGFGSDARTAGLQFCGDSGRVRGKLFRIDRILMEWLGFRRRDG